MLEGFSRWILVNIGLDNKGFEEVKAVFGELGMGFKWLFKKERGKEESRFIYGVLWVVLFGSYFKFFIFRGWYYFFGGFRRF